MGSSISVKSPPPVRRTNYIRSPVLNPASPSTHPPQCSSSTATASSSHDDSKKFCSLFRYRHQPPATFKHRSSAGFYHVSSASPQYHSPPGLPLNRTNLSEPSQKNSTGIASDGLCLKIPQVGLCSPSRTRVDTHSGDNSSFCKSPENRKMCHGRGEVGQLHIPVVIHSERERKWSSPGNRNGRRASGGDRQNFFYNVSPVKAENLIVIDLVDDDDDSSTQTSKTVGGEKMDDSNRGLVVSQAMPPIAVHQSSQATGIHQVNQDREILNTNETGANLQSYRIKTNRESNQTEANHHSNRIGMNRESNETGVNLQLNRTGTNRESNETAVNLQSNQMRTNNDLDRPRANQIAPVDQIKFQKADRNSWIKELERFIGKKPEEEPKRNEPTGSKPVISTSSEVIAKSGLPKNISQHQSNPVNATASNQPTKTTNKPKQVAPAQRLLAHRREPVTKKESSNTTAGFSPTKREKPSTLKNLKSTKALNPVRTPVSGRVPSVPRTGVTVSGNQQDMVRQGAVKAYEEEAQGLVGVLKLLKVLDAELVWPSSAEWSWEEDVTKTTKVCGGCFCNNNNRCSKDQL